MDSLPVVYVTGADLINMMEQHPNKGAKIAYIIRQTEVKLNKKHRETKAPCPFNVVKVTGLTFTFGADYTNAMNKALGEDVRFMTSLLWAKRMPDGTVRGMGKHVGPYTVEHMGTGDLYFFGKPAQKDAEVRASFSYMVDTLTGQQVTKEALQPYMGPEQARPVMIWHTYKFDSVIELTYGGMIYRRIDVQRYAVAA